MIRISLSQDSFKLGRAKTSDYVIRESDMGSSRWLTAVSKCQCEIIKNDKGVFLKDRSSNGENLNMKNIWKINLNHRYLGEWEEGWQGLHVAS